MISRIAFVGCAILVAAAFAAPAVAADTIWAGVDLSGDGTCDDTWGPQLPEKVDTGVSGPHHVCLAFPP